MANRRLAVIAASGHGIRCDGCKHWDPPAGPMLSEGTCELAVAPGDQLAYVRADWGYEASLFTAPDFGCVQFEAKDSNDAG